MRRLGYIAAGILALGLAPSAEAASVTVEFPSALSTQNASGAGPFYFSAAHFAEETFADTGVAGATELDLSLTIDNALANPAFVNFDVFVNGALAGAISFSGSDGDGTFDFSLTFANAAPAADDYTILLDVTNTVLGGQGSIDFIEGASFATLSDGAAAVPAPLALPLLASAVAVLGLGARRRRTNDAQRATSESSPTAVR